MHKKYGAKPTEGDIVYDLWGLFVGFGVIAKMEIFLLQDKSGHKGADGWMKPKLMG